ncbi:hypothetical protein MKQ70_37015 [Chitinophaga sedimenti]|uniref:hypothetical protein n=1 Tax=Chitinophaga sedimenti TaxID=2033606 RepID=UPI0020062009|nr:hypothetical protein [Chitinophaga sedimenti]MCK7560213.1 hypothetical protein [Chitinophaga sedimenti]
MKARSSTPIFYHFNIMVMHMDHSKFREYLLLKGYSTASIDTTVRVVGYLWRWAKTENIAALSETSYSDILAFVRWSSEGGASQRRCAVT